MAGLGEAFSHIGATMFYLLLASEYAKRNLKGQDACTSMPCSWPPPSAKDLSFVRLSEINFQDPKKKFENVEKDPAIASATLPAIVSPPTKCPKLQFNKPTNEEK